MYSDAAWANPYETLIVCDLDGETVFIPADGANRNFQELMAEVNDGDLTIGPYVPPDDTPPPPPDEEIPDSYFIKDTEGNTVKITMDADQRITTEVVP